MKAVACPAVGGTKGQPATGRRRWEFCSLFFTWFDKNKFADGLVCILAEARRERLGGTTVAITEGCNDK